MGIDVKSRFDSSRIYKIRYTVNMLPMIGAHVKKVLDPYSKIETKSLVNDDVNLLSLCTESDELDMFETFSLQSLISFKWQQFANSFHMFGCFIHILYIVILFIYTEKIYIEGLEAGSQNLWAYILLLGILYPTVYETVQMLQIGLADYWSDVGNLVDCTYIWGSVVMSFLHATENPGPYHWVSKLLMIVVGILAIRRTFNFMRVFTKLSPIVTMLTNVFWRLRIFMTFYVILLLLFSLIFGVIGLGNYNLVGDYRTNFWIQNPQSSDPMDGELSEDAPTIVYFKIGQMASNFVQTLQLSLGDFSLLGPTIFFQKVENILFWIAWFVVLIITNVIFLNFIVAEASAIYSEVSESLQNYIQQQRADLVAEAESLIPGWAKKSAWFPKYIIIRRLA